MLNSLDNTAAIIPFTQAAPAAGAEVTFTVPVGSSYKIEAFFFTLFCSAVVANRIQRMQITDGTNTLWEGGPSIAMTASGLFHLGYARLGPNSPTSGSGNPQTLFFPDVWLPAGYQIKTSTSGLDVGDQYSILRGLTRASSADFI